MPNTRLLLTTLAAGLTIAVLACGGGDNTSSSTPTLSADATLDASATEGATPDVSGPAEAVAIFAAPEDARRALAAAAELPDVRLLLLSGSAIGDGEFAPELVPTGVELRGARVIPTSRETGFGERFSAAYDYPDPEPPGFREAYDSVYLVALASFAAASVDPTAVRDQFHFVANSPGAIIITGPEGWEQASEELSAGNDIDLTGASGLADLTTGGEASKGAADVWTVIDGSFTPLETRDVDLAAEVGAENPQGQLAERGPAPETPLVIGAILPLSGELEAVGAALSNAMQLAVDEINAVGGVFGQDIELIVEDDAGSPDGAVAAPETLPAAGVAAIIGPADGLTAAAAAERFESPAQITLLTLTPWAGLATVEDGGRVFSLVALETVETPVLANLMRERELAVACVLYQPDPAGQAMADAFALALELKGGAVRASEPLPPDAGDLPALLAECVGS